MAVATQGTLWEVETTPGGGTYTPIGEMQSWDGPTSAKPEIETTDLQAVSKTYIPGLADQGTITLAGNFTAPEDAGQAILRANFEATAAPIIKLRVTVGTAPNQRRFEIEGFISESPVSGQTDSKIDIAYTIRVNTYSEVAVP